MCAYSISVSLVWHIRYPNLHICVEYTSWSPSIGDELSVQPESDNVFDEFEVAVREDNTIVGHILRSQRSPSVLPPGSESSLT